MNNQIMLSIIEVFISLVIESTILAGVFSYLANKANEKQETQLKEEMHRIEEQNKLIFEQLQQQIKEAEARIMHAIDLTCAKCIDIERKLEGANN
jgi:Tfp pilus assembly protein PilW